MENGLNLWDTAYAYGMGTSEKVLAEFIKELPRESCIISDKFTPQCTDSFSPIEMNDPDCRPEIANDTVQRDDNEIIRKALLSCDMVVFATPLYYYGMSAQLKVVVDRFCAYNSSLNRRHLKQALLTVAWNADDWTFEALQAHYKTLVRYINFEDKGMVLGYGCGSPSMTRASGFPEKAYKLGRSL